VRTCSSPTRITFMRAGKVSRAAVVRCLSQSFS
jgi:hypothetical protein